MAALHTAPTASTPGPPTPESSPFASPVMASALGDSRRARTPSLIRHQVPLVQNGLPTTSRDTPSPGPLLKLRPILDNINTAAIPKETKCPSNKPSSVESHREAHFGEIRPIQMATDQPAGSFPSPPNGAVFDIVTKAKYAVELTLGNNDMFLEFIHKSLMAIGTRLMKTMCKSFIKTIDPNRRKTYPYSKSTPKSSEPQVARYPPWWPPDVRFKEPDHLIQPECERLIEFLLTWCLADEQFRTRHGIKTLSDDMWSYYKVNLASDEKPTEEGSKKLFMLEQLLDIASQRESLLKDEIGETDKFRILFFEHPAPYRARKLKRKRSPSLDKASKPSIYWEEPAASSSAEPRDEPTPAPASAPAPAPKKCSRPRHAPPPEVPKLQSKASLHGRVAKKQRREDQVTAKQNVELAEGPLCESCSTCNCRNLLPLPSRPAPLKVEKEKPSERDGCKKRDLLDNLGGPVVPGVPNKSQLWADESADGPSGSVVPGVANKHQHGDDDPADDLRDGWLGFSVDATALSTSSGGFLQSRPAPDRMQLFQNWSFGDSSCAFTSPGAVSIFIGPEVVDGPVDGFSSFGGRLDQVAPATPSEKGFITDPLGDENAGSGAISGEYPEVHHAFKEDRRGSACETLPHVNSPRPADGERRFSLPEPTLGLLFEPRSVDHRVYKTEAETWDDWQPQTGDEPEPEGGSEYQPEDEDSGSDRYA